MEKEIAQEIVVKLANIDKHLAKTAEALSVLKVMAIAFLIAFLMVVFKNFS